MTLRRDTIRVIDALVVKESAPEQKGEAKDAHPKQKTRSKARSLEMKSNLQTEVSRGRFEKEALSSVFSLELSVNLLTGLLMDVITKAIRLVKTP